MIEGFRVIVTPHEMEKHLLVRAQYHHAEAENLTSKITAIKEKLANGGTAKVAEILGAAFGGLGAETMALGGFQAAAQGDQIVMQIASQIENHKDAATAFEFYARHLGGDNYALSMSEASQLEFIDNGVMNVAAGYLAPRRRIGLGQF